MTNRRKQENEGVRLIVDNYPATELSKQHKQGRMGWVSRLAHEETLFYQNQMRKQVRKDVAILLAFVAAVLVILYNIPW